MQYSNVLKKFMVVGVCVGTIITSSAAAVSQTSKDIKSELDTAITMRNTAHQLAECARTLGADEDDYIILHAKDKWDEHNETVVALTEDYNKALKAEREAEAKRKAEEEAKRKAEENSLISKGTFRISFYTGSPDEGGCWTAIGTRVSPWYTVAVDPSVIPLGTKLKIEGFSGTFVAQDTGSAIYGNRLDLAVSSKSEANNLGIQYRKVYIVK